MPGPDAERCCQCFVFRYFDVNDEGGRTADDAYICPGCVARLDGKPSVPHRDLVRFLKDPDVVNRLEQRVRDLESIVAAFAQRAAA